MSNIKTQTAMLAIMAGGFMMTSFALAGIKSEQKRLHDDIREVAEQIPQDVECRCEECETAISESVSSVETTVIESEEIPETSVINVNSSPKFEEGEEVPLPQISTTPKLYTDYRFYNLPNTPHYRLQQVAWTDEDGLRRFNEDYIVGLGRFYSVDIGDRFRVTLETGSEFTIILGDGKAPCDCDENNQYTPCKNYSGEDCANVLEFIVDKNAMNPAVYGYGSIDCIDKFKGDIAKMVYLGRDNSADWTTYY